MGYCNLTEVRSMIKEEALNAIIGSDYIDDPDEREVKIIPIIEGAIVDADAEIDGYLASRYPIPLTKVPQIINKFSKDIAVYNLYSRMGIDENEREKNYLNRYKAAIKFLELLSAGKVDIGTVDRTTTAKNGFSMNSSTRLFSRNSLKGM